jgi:hypothetical protein
MIISHSHRYIFIKSTKTAGTSVEAALSNHCSGDDVVTALGDYEFNRDETGAWVHKAMNEGPYRQHDDALTIRANLPAAVWDGYFKFSIARNPWERTLSRFFWNHRGDPALKPRAGLLQRLGVPQDDLGPARTAFARFLREENWDTNDRFYVIDGKFCVDFVIRYERLGDDLLEVCRRVGLPQLHLPQLKAGMRSKKHHYSEYYDDAGRDLVAKRHQNDIRLFGYRFENPA